MNVVAIAARSERTPSRSLDAALAIAARGDGLTFIAMRVPLVAPSTLVDAWPDVPLVAWSSTDVSMVGVGVAAELRGAGPERFAQVVAAARETRIHGAIVVAPIGVDSRLNGAIGAPPGTDPRHNGAHHASDTSSAPLATPIDTLGYTLGAPTVTTIDALGFARPRFLGGAAFTPGAANAQPWTGYGDAWFALPRWTYVSDDATAWLVLAVDPTTARESVRCDAELAVFRRALATDAPTWARPSTDDSTARFASTADSAPTWARPSTDDSTPRGPASYADSARVRDSHAKFDTSDEASDLYRAQVEAITSAIANGDCSKVVAARSCAIALDDTATVATALAALDARHPECFRIVVRPPGGGALVAATPERLVRLDNDGIRCDALAGTVRLDTTDAEARLLASDKDRREHAIVVDAIGDALASVGAKLEAPGAPAIKRLRHVLHLHTPIRASVPRDSRSLHLLDLAARLHPTPAVGGTPTAFAVDWIRDHEPMPRGWYASPVGWFDLDGNGELAVAIRSGVLVGNRAHLWAGAGIVAGSDPDRELAETELKLRAMLGALRGGAS